MASQIEMLLLSSVVVNLGFFGAVIMIWREFQSERRERLTERAHDRNEFRRHTHSLASGRVWVPPLVVPAPPVPLHAPPLPPPAPPSSGPVCVISSGRERVDPLAQTATALEQRDTLVDLMTTLPSEGVRR